jgi:hypothetical protein
MKGDRTAIDPAVSSWRNGNEMSTMIPTPVARFVWNILQMVEDFRASQNKH